MMSGKPPLDALSIEDSNLMDDEEGGGGSLLAGMELDEEAVRTQQILEQIRNMVEDSPDKTAVLVSKWLDQE